MRRNLALVCATGVSIGTASTVWAVDFAWCAEDDRVPSFESFYGHGWGTDSANTRYQPPNATSIRLSNIRKLRLKWAYKVESAAPRSYPIVTDDTVFIGTGTTGVVALDKASGCTRWQTPLEGDAGVGLTHAKLGDTHVLFTATRDGGVYAIDAATGERMWRTEIDEEPTPTYSGTPLAIGKTLFVPMSSYEIGLAMIPAFGCCITSGAMVALDSSSGEQLWYRRTIDQPAEKVGRHWIFVNKYAPSGATVWMAPTFDAKRNAVYFGTGQNFSLPASETSDAIFSVDATTGEINWVRQMTANDAYNLGCNFGPTHPNCPQPMGPDYDFGAAVILTQHRDGADVLLAGQKSGDVYALDADTGNVRWSKSIGRGGLLGGVHFGMAVHPELNVVFVPISDRPTAWPLNPNDQPGVFALDIDTGETVWSYVVEAQCPDLVSCWPGFSAAPIATPELVFAGNLEGDLLGFDAATGEVVWEANMLGVPISAVNGVGAYTGSFDAHGPQVADDMLFISSGYGTFDQKPGNAFLAFALESD